MEGVAAIVVPLPAQGHLNQLLQLSCLISSYGLPVYYVASAVHNRQARVRVNGLDPLHVSKINFHDIPTPPFATPPPDPNSSHSFPTHIQPLFFATFAMRDPFSAYLREMANNFRRVVVVHDSMMSVVVQDVVSVSNAESYALNCISAFSLSSGLQLKQTVPYEIDYFSGVQVAALKHRAGDIYNTCRLMEGPYLDVLDKAGNRKSWAIGPILPAISISKSHKCLEWLDKQDPKSVILVSFGTSTTLLDEEIRELAMGLEQSGVKFVWVLRDADRGNVFEGESRRSGVPQGFEERIRGIVVRDWAPQPEMLAHPSIGGFMSHCGWNSCIESLTMGVPLAAWPMHSDQPLNAQLLTQVLKTGLLVREWTPNKQVVKASTIHTAVTRLMVSEEGKEIRNRAQDLAATLRKATQPGGASRVELDSFIAHVTR